MRLWAQQLLSYLPDKQINGQHNEICGLRGGAWGKKHAIVDYAFNYPMEALFAFHTLVIAERDRRGFKTAPEWRNPNYRGKRCEPYEANPRLIKHYLNEPKVYFEHDEDYLETCLMNLKSKGIIIKI